MRTHQKVLNAYSTINSYVVSIVVLIGIFYCPFVRSFSDILKYAGSLFIFFLLFIKHTTEHFIDDSEFDWKPSLINSKLKRYLIGVVMTMIMAYMFYAMGVTFGEFYTMINTWTPIIFKILNTLILIITGGFLLFELRIKHRSIFGIIEAMIGASIILYKLHISSEKSVESFFTIMTSGFLLIVKGYDDIDQGKIEKEKEKANLKEMKPGDSL